MKDIYQILGKVAPRVGAWIETLIMQQDVVAYGSHPVWVRGLKLLWVLLRPLLAYVAPRVGAWIETMMVTTNLLVNICRTPCGCVD